MWLSLISSSWSGKGVSLFSLVKRMYGNKIFAQILTILKWWWLFIIYMMTPGRLELRPLWCFYLGLDCNHWLQRDILHTTGSCLNFRLILAPRWCLLSTVSLQSLWLSKNKSLCFSSSFKVWTGKLFWQQLSSFGSPSLQRANWAPAFPGGNGMTFHIG